MSSRMPVIIHYHRLLACLLPVAAGGGAPLRWLLVACDPEEAQHAQRSGGGGNGEAAAAPTANPGSDEQFAARWGEQVAVTLGSCLICDTAGAAEALAAAAAEPGGECDCSGLCPVVAASPAAAQLLGVSAAELASSGCLALAGPDTAAGGMRKLIAAQLGGGGGWAKLLLYRRDGSPFWALAYACPLSPVLQPAKQQQAGGSGGGGGTAPSSSRETSSGGGGTAAADGGGGGGQVLVLLADVTSARLRRLGKYVMGKVVGQGASGVVRMGKNPATGEGLC